MWLVRFVFIIVNFPIPWTSEAPVQPVLEVCMAYICSIEHATYVLDPFYLTC